LIIYDLFLKCYALGIRLVSLWSVKAQLWLKGRQNIFALLQDKLPKDNRPLVWMHCASLGEFEQGRPLLEKIKQTYPDTKILLTFFSPSGYEVRKHYEGADLVAYLPMDGASNARAFLDTTQPLLAIFVKYESWFHYLKTLQQRKIPTILVSAIFTRQQNYFGPLGGFLRKMLDCYTHIFVQDNQSLHMAKSHGIAAPCSISGDTRFDRVVEIASQPFTNNLIEKFCQTQTVLVAGSTWKDDENIIAGFLHKHPEIKAVIAPHETDESSCKRLLVEFPHAVLLSQAHQSISPQVQVLIIDSMGMLSKLYRWATIAYIGGGFNKSGIHNVLEAAVYGKVTVFGPNHDRSAEAAALIENGSGFSIATGEQFNQILDQLLGDKHNLALRERMASEYVQKNQGATAIILDYIKELGILDKS
jgi:3-deoxy-D-manno-octulosonic-acid transferase